MLQMIAPHAGKAKTSFMKSDDKRRKSYDTRDDKFSRYLRLEAIEFIFHNFLKTFRRFHARKEFY